MSRTWGSDESLDRWSSEMESMAVDLAERDDSFVVTVDLPGFERDEVDVRVTDYTLRIEVDEEEERYLCHERRHESTRQSVWLPAEVDKKGVEAKMKNGVLTVTLPKLEVDEAKDVKVE